MSKATPAKRRGKKKYYKKHSIYGKINRFRRYHNLECRMILNHNISDIALAMLLGRSLISIQIKRVRLKKKISLLLKPRELYGAGQ